ncbi:hypothetical protein BOX15_Mlig014889g2 [Macrostomum lignano]|uniref:Sushi domain-containing protein n=2 Tax=Macrostomum lignano TaxID=282301 RepID=A0A1I8ICU2_9PLAT|nr:hypothetical protein BOX15_Mlig014889g2 [Macrostomum lignano]
MRRDEFHSDSAMLLSTLILLLSNHFLSADSTPSIVAVNENDVFNFDFTWRPLRPMANETVHFRAIDTGQSVMQRWSLTNTSFRWYRQLPSADFRLVHVGRRYSRRASGYFEGRYRLSVRVNGQPQPESDNQPTSWSRVDIVKYIGLQRRIHSALIVKNRTTKHGRGRRIVCRFWGYPQVESLEFRPPTSPHSPAVCRTMSGHFETIETEPYIDLVSDCSTDTLPAGEYSCYGRNSVGEGRLKCRLDEGQGEFLGNMTQCWDTLAEDSSVESSRKVYRQIVANNGINKPESVAMATAFGCLATAFFVLII